VATGMKIWRRIVGCTRTVLESVDCDPVSGDVLIAVRPWKRDVQCRCGGCGRRCAGYDQGEGRRRWRHLDCGTLQVWLEADAPRVDCPDCGPTVAALPWARHDCRYTRPFEDQIAWMATEMSKSAVCELMRITWRSVGRIVRRVCDDAVARHDVLDGLRIVGLDEVSHRRGQRYLTVAVNHDTGLLVWANEGRDSATVGRFFDDLGDERSDQVEAVTADGASWIANVVTERTDALLCTDPFHVVQWATDAVDEVRRNFWRDLRYSGDWTDARDVKGLRWALLKNPENLTGNQRGRLADVIHANGKLYRAWLLKEELRLLLKAHIAQARPMLTEWLAWASRSKLPPFVELARRIRRHRESIENTIEWGLSNGLVESVNTRIRMIMRRGYGFHSPQAVIALAMLDLGGLCPPLPHQQPNPAAK